jgi:glycosyltransferase involved in cell wall biosynthesis
LQHVVGGVAKVSERTIDVVVPALHDLAAARRCARYVIDSRNATAHELIVVTGPAIARERTFMLDAPEDAVNVIRGRSDDYAGLVNQALALHPDRDIVLLRVDAEVHGAWLDRLAAHAGEQGMGAVGTFTNVAGSAVYALAKAAGALPRGATAETLDALFARVNAGDSADAAGLHGPCLYLTRAGIERTGAFRTFSGDDGRLTEIDYMLRLRDAGFSTRIAGDVFVAVGPEAVPDQRATVATLPGAGALAHLHPGCQDAMTSTDSSDTLRLLAGRVDIARLAASPLPVLVFVSHAWGGGIRRYMDDLRFLLRGRADVLYIEPANAEVVKLHAPDDDERFAAWFRLPDDLPLLAGTLRAIGVARLHYHHVHGLPQAILDLPEASGIPHDCTLHDYYAICPQYHLAGRDGRYCGEPDEAGCRACVGDRPIQWNLDVAGWRKRLGTFVRRAGRVIAPSHDVAARIERHLPGLAIEVWSHPEAPIGPLPPIVRVVTLGNLSREKGLDVVARCAAAAKRDALPLAFRVLGSTTEPVAQSPDVPLTIHGSYVEAQLSALLAAEHADVLFFPAQVPETYSYTLSIALAAGTPIVASSLGALPERLADRADARLVRWDASAEEWNQALLDAAGATARGIDDVARSRSLSPRAPIDAMSDAS